MKHIVLSFALSVTMLAFAMSLLWNSLAPSELRWMADEYWHGCTVLVLGIFAGQWISEFLKSEPPRAAQPQFAAPPTGIRSDWRTTRIERFPESHSTTERFPESHTDTPMPAKSTWSTSSWGSMEGYFTTTRRLDKDDKPL